MGEPPAPPADPLGPFAPPAGYRLEDELQGDARFDDTPPRPVRVEQFVQTTHKFIVREYKIEYRFLDDPAEKHDRLTTPDEVAEFQVPLGVAEVRGGWLGWPWVQDIRPVRMGGVAQPPPAN